MGIRPGDTVISVAVPVSLQRRTSSSSQMISAAVDPRRRPEQITPPSDSLLVDSFGRVHKDLRISLTDRCNFRCVYCMPEEGVATASRSQHLRADEIVRIARVARNLGVRSVRLTGGEPLLRGDVVEIVAALSSIGFDDLALTTNGWRLGRLARSLYDAGLDRVNVSCDSLRPDRFGAIRRRGELAHVLTGMDLAERSGLAPVKVNVVMIAGVNDDEIEDFAQFARRTGRIVRFIEFMPLDAQQAWHAGAVVPGESIIERINRRWPVRPAVSTSAREDEVAPAERFVFADGLGEIGIVASVTKPFCGTCDRLRLTADGVLRNCLFGDDELSLREIIRSGGDDVQIAAAFRRATWQKRAGHGVDEPGFCRPFRPMSAIGG